MAADTAAKPRRPYAFADGPVVRLADLELDPSDDSIEDRLDGPAAVDPGPSSPNKKRDTEGEPLKMSFNQLAEFFAANEALWELHDKLAEKLTPPPSKPGRPVEAKNIDLLLFWLMTWTRDSVRSTEAELHDPGNWARICGTVAATHRDNPTRRLSAEPPSRWQYMRFRDKIAARADFGDWLDSFDDICVQLAVFLGMFDADASRSNPPITSNARADGSWLPSLWKARIDQAVDPETDEQIRRYDPEALQYTRNNAGRSVRQAGNHYVALTVHGGIRGVRVPLSTRVLSQPTPDNPQSECTRAVQMTKRIKKGVEKHGGEIRTLSFDGGMHPQHRDDLMDMGIIPVSTVQRKAGGAYAERPLGKRPVTLANGKKVQHEVVAVDGGIALKHRLANGDEIGIELERSKTIVEPGLDRCLVRGYFRVPRDDTVPKRLHGATLSIRHNSTDTEIENGRPRTRALDVFPPNDPVRAKHHGARQDIESYNSDLKRVLINGRARTVTQNRVMFELAGFNLSKAFRALAYPMRHHGQ